MGRPLFIDENMKEENEMRMSLFIDGNLTRIGENCWNFVKFLLKNFTKV